MFNGEVTDVVLLNEVAELSGERLYNLPDVTKASRVPYDLERIIIPLKDIQLKKI